MIRLYSHIPALIPDNGNLCFIVVFVFLISLGRSLSFFLSKSQFLVSLTSLFFFFSNSLIFAFVYYFLSSACFHLFFCFLIYKGWSWDHWQELKGKDFKENGAIFCKNFLSMNLLILEGLLPQGKDQSKVLRQGPQLGPWEVNQILWQSLRLGGRNCRDQCPPVRKGSHILLRLPL